MARCPHAHRGGACRSSAAGSRRGGSAGSAGGQASSNVGDEMPRLTRQELIDRLCDRLQGTPDPTHEVDVRLAKGVLIVAATPGEIPAAVERLKPLLGYRFLGLHHDDLVAARRAGGQTKIGILDQTGATLQAADLKPRGRWLRPPPPP